MDTCDLSMYIKVDGYNILVTCVVHMCHNIYIIILLIVLIHIIIIKFDYNCQAEDVWFRNVWNIRIVFIYCCCIVLYTFNIIWDLNDDNNTCLYNVCNNMYNI